MYFCFLGWPVSSIHVGAVMALEFSRDTETIGYVYIWREIYFKESAHTITEAENSGPRRMDGVCYSKSKSRGRRSVSQLKDGQAERNFF